MKTTLPFVLAGTALCAAFQLPAQEAAGPPAVLRIFREDIKAGQGIAHENTEAAVMRGLAASAYPSRIVGLNSLSGTSQAWFLEGHPTFASIAASDAALSKPEVAALLEADEEHLTGSRSWIAVYRPGMSYATDKINLPKARYVNIITIRVRAGLDQEFADLAKSMVDGAAKAGLDQPVAIYQVVSGAPNGTYLLLEPTESLKSMDEAPQRTQALNDALGDAALKRVAKAASETIANEEAILFAIDPEISYPPKTWAAEDPEFWGPKVTVTSSKPPAKSARKSPKQKTASR